MLGYTASQGVFMEWLGQELLKARQQVASLYAMVKQLQGQPVQPPAPDPRIVVYQNRLSATGLQLHTLAQDVQAIETFVAQPVPQS